MKNFFYSLFSEDGGLSSKRFVGTVCVLSFNIMIFISLFIDLQDYQVDMANKLIYVGAGLLGVTIFNNMGKIFNKK